MKRLAIGLISVGMILGAANFGFAKTKTLSTTSIEESFVNAVGACAPSSNVAGALGKTHDPAMQFALRDALILEAADDAGNVAGANQSHSACMRKALTASGFDAAEMEVLPYCVKHDWPDPFDDLGVCVEHHARLQNALKLK
ncbi:MAG: hypothetical protein ACREQI_15880 [Candidatus Binataceae bacterium]